MQPMLWFRLLFIPIHAFCLYYTLNPPNPAPPSVEQDKYRTTTRKIPITETGFTVIHAAYILLHVVLAIDVVELVTLTALASFPTIHPFSDYAMMEALQLQLNASFLPVCTAATFITAGSLLRFLSYRELGRFFTFQLSIRDGHRLVKSGPYHVVRHPGYLGAVLVLAGNLWYQLGPSSVWTQLGLWGGGSIVGCVVGAIVVSMSTYGLYGVLARVPVEDRVLKERFEAEWVAWARQTPYKVIPFVY